MEKIKIFASDGFSKEGVEILEAAGIFDIKVQSKTAKEELLDIIDGYDALIIRSASTANQEVITKGKNLKLVARAGVGLDNVDINAATERGIVVMNAPGGNTISAAELAFALMMSLARKVPQASASMKTATWDKKSFAGGELNGKNMGVIGLGRIGREFATRAKAFNMTILGYDPYFTKEQAENMGITLVDNLEEIYKQSDYISVHTPLTKDTENLITAKELAMMKPTASIINCARGGIINEEDLYEALKNKVIASAALDVFTSEPPMEYLFKDLDNCITTPHLGASTEEAQISVAIETARAIVSYFRDGVPFSSVNYPSVDKETLESIKDYVKLADIMGRMMGNIAKGEISKFQVSYVGHIAEKQTKMVSYSAVKGYLNGSGASDDVNFVNVPLVAKNHGINYEEKTESASGVYSDIVMLKVVSGGVLHELWGSVFEYDRSIRIVKYNNYHIEIKPHGIMLMLQYADRVGFVAMIGALMLKNNINIADMSFVREENETLMMLTLDSEISNAALEELRADSGIMSVNYFVL